MINFLFYAVAFLLAIGVLVVVHEFGHYLAARLCGVKVLRFSFGFGKVLFSRCLGRDQTEWAFSLFPLGGYVKMLDEREGEVAASELDRAFNRQSIVRRTVVVAAGPLANFLLAILLYWVLFMHGTSEFRPLLAAPAPASVAAQAGVSDGALVLSVNNKAVATWEELRWELMQRIVDREPALLEVQDTQRHIAFLRLETKQIDSETLDRNPIAELGLVPYRPRIKAVIGTILPDSPAQAAGVQSDDEVVALNGKPLSDWSELVVAIRKLAGQEVALDVVRNGKLLHLQVTPTGTEEQGVQVGRIGVGLRDDPQLRASLMVLVSHSPIEALQRAVRQTWETSALTLRMIGRMLIGEISLKNLSGPVTMADYAGQSARLGFSYYLKFLAVISIGLGVFNLLPVPMLDGGHLLYYSCEALKGSPLSEKFIEVSQRVGMTLLLLLMASALFNDINRLFFS